MKKHSFFADNKLQVDQVKKKIEERFIKPLFIYLIIFKSRNDHKISSKKLNKLAWNCLGSQLDLSFLSFDLICSVLYY